MLAAANLVTICVIKCAYHTLRVVKDYFCQCYPSFKKNIVKLYGENMSLIPRGKSFSNFGLEEKRGEPKFFQFQRGNQVIPYCDKFLQWYLHKRQILPHYVKKFVIQRWEHFFKFGLWKKGEETKILSNSKGENQSLTHYMGAIAHRGF